MPTVACPNPVNCESAEAPVSNLSAEGPDVAKCFRYSFNPISASVCEFDLALCNAFADVGADVGILCDPPDSPPGGPNPPPPVIYSSSAKSCTVNCGDGTSETYTVVGGTFVALSKARADSDAANFACRLAAIQCNGPVTTFTNTAQTCTFTCPNGDISSFTTPAAFFTALSQSEANSNAYLFACEVAAQLCGTPPVGLYPGAGTDTEPPIEPVWANSAQSCTSVCPDGSIFTYIIAAGTYTSESRAAANAIAYSAACSLANSFRFCLSSLPATVCINQFFFAALAADGSASTTFSLASGTLPPGLTLTSQGYLQGVPNTPGRFTFTIRATNQSNGNSSARSYTMNAIEITPSTLPDATRGTAYAQALNHAGTSGSVTWAVTAGSLPAGLTLHPGTGVISGTPTTAGTFTFTASVTDSTGSCTKNLSIKVTGFSFVPLTWVAPTTFTTAGATASGSFASNTFSASATVVSNPPDFRSGYAYSNTPFGAELPYTGTGQICNLRLVVTQNAVSAGCNNLSTIQVDQNFVAILTVDLNLYPVGTYDIPFTIPAGTNSLISVSLVQAQVDSLGVGAGSAQCSFSGTLTP